MDLETLSLSAIDAALLRAAPLAEFIPLATPGFSRPDHLAPLVGVLERALREPIEVVVSVPVRHGKTSTLEAWVVWLLLQDPTLTICYCSHADDFSEDRCRNMLRMAERVGVEIGNVRRQDLFETRQGGRVKAVGIHGQLAGEGFRVIVLDDPIKGRLAAESPVVRESVWQSFCSDVYTRRDPLGTSTIICQARWHPDDLAGRLVADGWEEINLPAIDESTDPPRALWPAKWPVAKLERIRRIVGSYAWASLFQGQPRPRGGVVFAPPTWCERVPDKGQVAFGVDLAYSSRTRADYSVDLRLVKAGAEYIVADVDRAQMAAPAFVERMKRTREDWPGAESRWYTGGGGERGVADLLAALGVEVDAVPATADKFLRAQGVAAAWNAGLVLVPRGAPWAEAFVDEVCSFTGLGDRHDDQVDALAAAYDCFDSSRSDEAWSRMVRGMSAMIRADRWGRR